MSEKRRSNQGKDMVVIKGNLTRVVDTIHTTSSSLRNQRRGRGRKKTGKRRSNQGKDMVVIKGS